MSTLGERTPLRDLESGTAYDASENPDRLTDGTTQLADAPTTRASMNRASSYLVESKTYIADQVAGLQSSVVETQNRLVRSASGRLFPKPTVFCGICLEHVDKELCYSFTGGDFVREKQVDGDAKARGGCGHLYCQDCLVGYLRLQILEFNASPACPYTDEPRPDDEVLATDLAIHDHQQDTPAAVGAGGGGSFDSSVAGGFGCGARASEADVRHLFKSAVYSHALPGGAADVDALLAKYAKALRMAEDPHYRECPETGCGHMQLPARDFLGRVKKTMVCEKCAAPYCFEHANSHPNETCLQYIRRTSREEAVSRDFMKRTLKCKPCPSCGFQTEKNRGCNHMACTRCKTDWCWLCGQNISQVVTGREVDHHYNPTNLRGCPGSQFSQGNGEFLVLDRLTSYLWWLVFALVMTMVSVGYIGALAALCVATGCCFGCCCCCFGRPLHSVLEAEAIQALLVGPPLFFSLLAMTVLWMLLAVAWSLALTPLLLVTSVVWIPLIAAGYFEWGDVMRLWGFCGVYVYNSMAVQMIIHGGAQ